ncbi:hypothetical protein SLE2022_086940 [Rubroshorea leprosula]
MGNNYLLLIGLSLLLVAVDCATHDSKIVSDTPNSIKNNGGSNLDSNTVEDKTVSGNEGDQENISQDGIRGSLSKTDSTEQLGSKEGGGMQNGNEKSNPETKGKNGDFMKEKPSDVVDTKGLLNEGDHAGEASARKDGFRGEECDPSTMCTDKDNNFVACFQVPGNESPDIFLLIKNKGKGPRTISITAPAFVQLEKTQLQVPEKEDRKVKVSTRDGKTSDMIVLKEGTSSCNLDFKYLIMHNSGKDSDKSAKSYINLVSRSPSAAIVFFAALLMLASGWMCFSFRKRILLDSHSKYQRLDIELPVSAVAAKTEPDVNDGWDNNWGDNWDDEEAPHTPSMPVTPRLSSKGLASRRLNKEGWKD